MKRLWAVVAGSVLVAGGALGGYGLTWYHPAPPDAALQARIAALTADVRGLRAALEQQRSYTRTLFGSVDGLQNAWAAIAEKQAEHDRKINRAFLLSESNSQELAELKPLVYAAQ